jgi:UDP-glucose 4-epimerase
MFRGVGGRPREKPQENVDGVMLAAYLAALIRIVEISCSAGSGHGGTCRGLSWYEFAMHILITGASGFVGGAVTRQLLAAGHQVTATTTSILPEDDAGVHWIAWNGNDDVIPTVDFEALDGIVHMASPRDRGLFPKAARANFNLSVASTFGLLEQARRNKLRFVLTSSGDVAGGETVVQETMGNYAPTGFYGAALAAAEVMVGQYMSVMSAAVVRLFHPYGPGGDAFLVNRLFRRVMGGQTITLEGEAGIQLNAIWIDDVADGFARALASAETGIFHLAGPEQTSLRDLVTAMGRIAGKTPNIVATAAQPPDGHVGDCRRSRRLLGHEARIGITAGLELLAEQAHAAALP